MNRFKILGMTDSAGHCELCGTFCPRRRVAVQLVDVDGAANGEPQYWGVVCASEARHGRRDSTLARQLRAEAEEAGEYVGTAAGHRRGPRPTVRRQSRREAARMAELAAADARAIWFRTASQIPAELLAAEAGGRPCTPGGRYYTHDAAGLVDSTADLEAEAGRRQWLAAEARYLNAGQPRHAGHGYAHADGRRAIVNSTSPADVARFELAGFARVPGAELANWPANRFAVAAANVSRPAAYRPGAMPAAATA